MKKLLLSSVALAASFFSISTFAASDISYNWASVQYITEDLDDADCDQDGLTLSGNYEVHDNFFALGSFTDVSGDSGCGSETFSIGGGYKADFSEDASYFVSLSYIDTEVDFGSSDSGLIAAIGARALFTPDLEGRISISRNTAFDGNTVLSGGVSYWFLERLSFNGDVNLGSESSGIALGARFDF